MSSPRNRVAPDRSRPRLPERRAVFRARLRNRAHRAPLPLARPLVARVRLSGVQPAPPAARCSGCVESGMRCRNSFTSSDRDSPRPSRTTATEVPDQTRVARL